MNHLDLREKLFSVVKDQGVEANIIAQASGIIAGVENACLALHQLGLTIKAKKKEGSLIKRGDIVISFSGQVTQVIKAEDCVLSNLLKYSGIATQARKAVNLAQGKIKIVAGGWKKMPLEIKDKIRAAVLLGGAAIRISEQPFVYLDKNYINVFGSVAKTLKAAEIFKDHLKVIQIKGRYQSLIKEVDEAYQGGAAILMIDSGAIPDLKVVDNYLKQRSKKPLVAFAGNVFIDEIPYLLNYNLDILDIGTQILDAPLLDMKLDVVVRSERGGI